MEREVNRVGKKETLLLHHLLLLLLFWSHTQEKATSSVSGEGVGDGGREGEGSADEPFEILNGASVLPVTRPSFPRKHKEHYA